MSKKAWIRRTAPLALAGTVALAALAGCGSKKDDNATAAASPSASAASVIKDDALAALVPAKIRDAGKLSVATDASYAPNEFIDKDGKTIVGLDVDLGNAIGDLLGLKLTFTNTAFDGIIDAVGTRYDMSMSSFTDNKEREAKVDFVTYFSAGTALVVKGGSTLVLNSMDDLCGHSAAAEKGTTQLDAIDDQDKKCKAAGKPGVTAKPFTDQNGVTLAVETGTADAYLSDAPVAVYAAAQSGGKLQVSGAQFDTAPYGIMLPKASNAKFAAYAGLADAVKGAVQKLIDSGAYLAILKKWGVEDGAIQTAAINGAIS